MEPTLPPPAKHIWPDPNCSPFDPTFQEQPQVSNDTAFNPPLLLDPPRTQSDTNKISVSQEKLPHYELTTQSIPAFSQLPTPIRPLPLFQSLSRFSYDPALTNELIEGLIHGFDSGFIGIPANNLHVANLKSTTSMPDIVTDHIHKELGLGRMSGPFVHPPFESFQVSPIGLCEKKVKGTFRMIIDLSDTGSAINQCIDDTFAAVSYSTLRDAIKMVIQCGKGAYMFKTDIKSAFRLLPLRPSQTHLFCIKWNGHYYVDLCFPMGLRSACQTWEKLSTALEFVLRNSGIKWIIHYLDDFFSVNSHPAGCLSDMNTASAVCKSLGIPQAPDKTLGPSQVLDFTGFEIDSVEEVVRLPQEKLDKCKSLIMELLKLNSCTLRHLQSLVGLLNFCCTVIIAGKTFLRRLYNKMQNISKPYYKIRLTKDVKSDLTTWLYFLRHYNGVTLYREELFFSPDNVHLYTDAAKSIGYGAILDSHWFAAQWPSSWWNDQNITLLELIPIAVALDVWKHHLRNKAVTIHSDNQALVYALNNQSSAEHRVMFFMRKVVLNSLQNNFLIKVEHVSGDHNQSADALSRFQFSRFRDLNPQADEDPTSVPQLKVSMP